MIKPFGQNPLVFIKRGLFFYNIQLPVLFVKYKFPPRKVWKAIWPNMVFITSSTIFKQPPSKAHLAQLGFYGLPSGSLVVFLPQPSGPPNLAKKPMNPPARIHLAQHGFNSF